MPNFNKLPYSLCSEGDKNFCSALVTRFVVGNLWKNVREFYLKFLIGVLPGFNWTLSIYSTALWQPERDLPQTLYFGGRGPTIYQNALANLLWKDGIMHGKQVLLFTRRCVLCYVYKCNRLMYDNKDLNLATGKWLHLIKDSITLNLALRLS